MLNYRNYVKGDVILIQWLEWEKIKSKVRDYIHYITLIYICHYWKSYM